MMFCFFISCNNEEKSKTPMLLPPPVPEKISNGIKEEKIVEYIVNTKGIQLQNKFTKPFDDFQFDKVIAYDYDGDEEKYPSVINREGKFIAIIEKQKALNKDQIKVLIDDILTDNNTYGGNTAACFQPHLSFVFFNRDKYVFVIDICLSCNFLHSSKLIPATEFHKFKFEDGTEYPAIGFSKKGKEKIIQLAKELGLSYGKMK